MARYKAGVGTDRQELCRLRQEDCDFKSILGKLVIFCFKIKSKKMAGVWLSGIGPA